MERMGKHAPKGVVAHAASGQAFVGGGGQLAQIISSFDWSKTPLGRIEHWPTSIKTTIGLILRSPVPIVTLWGELGTMIYNDAYSVFAGGRHPNLLGSAVREGWPEVADFNDNVMKVVLAGGGTLSYKDQELTLFRSGAPEQVWMNLDYSPVLGESGRPIGVIAIVVETSEAVRSERRLRDNEARLRFLDTLGKEIAKSTNADTILAITTRMVAQRMGVSNCAYADMDADQDGFTVRGDWAAPGSPNVVGHHRLADFGKLAVERLRAGKPLVINDNLKELAPDEAATLQSIGIGATICMPLVK
jgi:PAS fold